MEDIMGAVSSSVRKHPLWWYFPLTFVLSWGAIVLAVWISTGGLSPTPDQFRRTVPVTVPAMLLGPAVAGMALTGMAWGTAGYRSLWSRLLAWRVGLRWYLFALLVAPVTMAVVVLVLRLSSPDYSPGLSAAADKAATVALAAVLGAVTGLFEEIGWTGFATPAARRRFSVLRTGILVGVLWGAWHFFVSLWGGGGTNGGISAGTLMSLWVLGVFAGQLTAFRVLMAWLYERTGSLLLAALMHASLTAFQFILNPTAPGVPQQVYPWGYAAAAWLVVGAVALAGSAGLTRRSVWHQSRGVGNRYATPTHP
ncbi:CPBP family intramembrane glutamic endopeptidase [Pseudarthrobacter enclensis]|uniref:CPBP family intramembrane glutamic endopeptidase n=1 Tax=Pseudarthrobacter enclensis TaxID=993070 RepID=UPI00130DE4CE|nr:CPBP family intramembrane glutamic endopeptidase [Pseudarthrobacter enclensis]